MFCVLALPSGFLFGSEIQEPDANKTIDSLLFVLKTLTPSSPNTKPAIARAIDGLKADTTLIKTLNDLSYQFYFTTNEYAKALQYAMQALTISDKLLSAFKEGKIYHLLKEERAVSFDNCGLIYYSQDNYQKALDYYIKSLKIREELRDKVSMAWSYNRIGTVYWYQGNYEKSLDNYLKAFAIYEEKGDKKGMADSYFDIGYIYLNQNNYEKALNNFSNQLKICEEIGYKPGIAAAFNGIGDFYEKKGDYDKELENHLKCLKIHEENKNNIGMARTYGNIGNAYYYKGDYPRALNNYFKFLKYEEESGNKRQIADAYSCIGMVYLKQNNFKKSDYYLNKALALSKAIGYKEITKQAYSLFSELYEKKDDYKHAFQYQKLFSEIKDTLLNEQSAKQIAEMNSRYESEKKDREIQLLNNENENQASLAANEHRKQQVILFSISGFSLSLLVFVMLIYRSFRQKKLLNKELEKLSIVASETDNGVLICGPKGELEWCNSGLTRLLGYTLEEIKQRGNTLEEVSANPEIKSLIRKSIENKKSLVYQTFNVAKDGKERWLQSTLTPILNEKGNIKRLVVIDTDVSDRKKIEEKLSVQNNELEKSRKSIEKKNLKIIDSITYAQQIQHSILTEESEIQHHLPESFIYFKPKDIVSGDFYWFSKIDDTIILAAIDCTGHGVPGAFMSMIGNTLMNHIVNERRNTKPSEILQLLNLGIYEALHQQKAGVLSHDGMDIALCSINYKKAEVQYAGAQNPLYVVWENNLDVIKADTLTIGGGGLLAQLLDPAKRIYTNHIIPLKKGMSIYMFSDGYLDQFGGYSREKFGRQKFKDLLLNNQHLNMRQQKDLIAESFEDWKGTQNQIDDVLVMGIRL